MSLSYSGGSLLAVGLLNRMWGSKQDRFARRVLNAVKETDRELEAWYDSDEFAIHYRRRPEESPATAYLHNLYREAADDDRGEQRDRIDRFIHALVFAPELPSEWEVIAPLLRPVLRPGTFGMGMGRGLVLQSRSAGVPFLAEYVVIDQPDSMAYVTTNHHDLWGVSAQEVFDTARGNLGRTGLAEMPSSGQKALVRMVESGDAYWASRLLLAGGLGDLTERVGGRPVAFVPDTSGVVVVVAEDPDLPPIFAMVEKEYREAVRPISPQGYTLDDQGRLTVYQAEPGTAAAVAVHKAELLLAAAEYHSQAEALNLSEEAFVAKLIVADGADRTFSVASWADGVDTLLPRAEYIAFSGENAEPFYTSWDSVVAEVQLTPVQGLRPERYRARTWPSAEVMTRLRANAVRL